MTNTLTDAEMRVKIVHLQKRTEDQEQRLTALRSGNVKPVDPAERAAIDKKLALTEKEWKQRKRLVQSRIVLILLVFGDDIGIDRELATITG